MHIYCTLTSARRLPSCDDHPKRSKVLASSLLRALLLFMTAPLRAALLLKRLHQIDQTLGGVFPLYAQALHVLLQPHLDVIGQADVLVLTHALLLQASRSNNVRRRASPP